MVGRPFARLWKVRLGVALEPEYHLALENGEGNWDTAVEPIVMDGVSGWWGRWRGDHRS